MLPLLAQGPCLHQFRDIVFKGHFFFPIAVGKITDKLKFRSTEIKKKEENHSNYYGDGMVRK